MLAPYETGDGCVIDSVKIVASSTVVILEPRMKQIIMTKHEKVNVSMQPTLVMPYPKWAVQSVMNYLEMNKVRYG